jgi:hypothetical protein
VDRRTLGDAILTEALSVSPGTGQVRW